jgi:hypothetical protein
LSFTICHRHLTTKQLENLPAINRNHPVFFGSEYYPGHYGLLGLVSCAVQAK